MIGSENGPEGYHLPGADVLVRSLAMLQAEQVFGTPEGRKTFLHSIDDASMLRMLGWACSITREVSPRHRSAIGHPTHNSLVPHFAHENDMDITYAPVASERRPELLAKILEGAKRAPTEEDKGLALGLGIVAVHMQGGSGRMARLAYTLMTRGYTGSPEDKVYYTAILQSGEGRYVIDLSTRRAQLNVMYGEYAAGVLLQELSLFDSPPAYVARPSLTKTVLTNDAFNNAKELAAILANEREMALANVLAIIRETGRSAGDYLIRGPNDEPVLDARRLVENLRQGEIDNVKRAHFNIKGGFVSAIIGCFADGDETIFGPRERLKEIYQPSNISMPDRVPPPPSAYSSAGREGLPARRRPVRADTLPSLPTVDATTEAIRRLTRGFLGKEGGI